MQIHQAQNPALCSNPESHQPLKPNSPRPSSARTTKRNMLRTDLNESLQKDLIWERRDKNLTSNAVLKRRHTTFENQNSPKLTWRNPMEFLSSQDIID